MKIKKYNTIGIEELRAVKKVIKKGELSSFLGSKGKNFLGGKKVREFENKIEKYFKVKYAVTFNSWTSGLIACVGSLDVSPGDEIIVTSWSMCATATSILHYNCIPVFADINTDTYNLDYSKIEKKITRKTKAIMVADIFGQSCNIREINKIAKKYNLKVICDSAQAIGSKIDKKFTGTLADLGGFSFNYHKHIHTGEGGVVVTNDKNLYRRLCLIRNHGEAVVGNESLNNIVGYNFRLGEIESAIGIEQLKKLNNLIKKRINICEHLTKKLSKLPFLKLPKKSKDRSNVYYLYPMQLDVSKIKYSRKFIVDKLKKEGVPGLIEGYVNIHKLPIFEKKIAYGKKNFPWSLNKNYKKAYRFNDLYNTELLHNKTFFAIEVCLYDLSIKDIESISKKFFKVWKKYIL